MNNYERGYVDIVWNGFIDESLKNDDDYIRGRIDGARFGVHGSGKDPLERESKNKKR